MKGLVGLSKCEWITYSRLLRVEKDSPPGFEPATYRSRSRHTNHSAAASHIQTYKQNILLIMPKTQLAFSLPWRFDYYCTWNHCIKWHRDRALQSPFQETYHSSHICLIILNPICITLHLSTLKSTRQSKDLFIHFVDPFEVNKFRSCPNDKHPLR